MFHRSRYNYWSSSKLSKYLRDKAGIKTPSALTSSGWDTHREEFSKKAPFTYWLTDTAFNKAQDVINFIPDCWYGFKTASLWKYFRTLYVLRKALWKYRSWDYTGLLMLMEESAKDMSHCQTKYAHHLNSEATAKELKVFAEFLKRVREDNYNDDKIAFVQTGNKKSIFGGWEHVQIDNTLPNYKHYKTFSKLVQAQRKNDLKAALNIMNRKLFHWWD